jgi:hypothetical protein
MLRSLGIVAGILALAVCGYYGWQFFSRPRVESPEELAQAALSAGTAEERETAAVGLSQVGRPAREHLLRVLAESQQPEVKVACIRGLAEQGAYRQMAVLLEALDDDSPLVRAQAGAAVEMMLKGFYGFNANDPPEQRREAVKRMRRRWQEFQNSKIAMAFAREQEGEDFR